MKCYIFKLFFEFEALPGLFTSRNCTEKWLYRCTFAVFDIADLFKNFPAPFYLCLYFDFLEENAALI